jgi:hypothetical protein
VPVKLRIGRDELSSAQNKTRGSYTRASCLPRAIRPSKLLAPRGLIGRRGGRPAVCGPLQPRCTPAPVQPSPIHFLRGSAVQSPIASLAIVQFTAADPRPRPQPRPQPQRCAVPTHASPRRTRPPHTLNRPRHPPTPLRCNLPSRSVSENYSLHTRGLADHPRGAHVPFISTSSPTM